MTIYLGCKQENKMVELYRIYATMSASQEMMRFPSDVLFDQKLCRLQINNLRKTKPLVESECKFHVGHIHQDIQYQFHQIGLRLVEPEQDAAYDELIQKLFKQTGVIVGVPGLINSLVLECIKHNCSAPFLRDVIDQYDSNGEISGMRLLISLNRLRKGIWEYNILERVECIEENFLRWSFRKCVFEMTCLNEVKPSLYNQTTIVTRLLHKANYHPKLDQFASNSMLIFDLLHDEFLDNMTSPNDGVGFSFELVGPSAMLDCIKSLGLDIESGNHSYLEEDILKKRKLQ